MASKNLWDLIEKQYSSKIKLENFRSIGRFNERLGSWSSIIDNSRYYKSLLLEFALKLDTEFHSSNVKLSLTELLNKIKNKNIGNPTEIIFNGLKINIDYLLSAEEILFLYKELDKAESIIEIGAGFGRLPHSILEAFPNIKNYYLVDLDFMLNFQKSFLKKVF